MSDRRVSRLAAVTFTLAPAIAGVMFFNLATWVLAFYGQYPALGQDDRFVLSVVFLCMAAGIAGACHGTYRFIRTGRVAQAGLWVLFAAACITGDLPQTTLNVFPLSIGIDVRMESSSLGVNFIGVGLLLAYSTVAFPRKRVATADGGDANT